ncbi:MAG: hypothetical protein JST01_10250, partial [Cyanobacteria bacterium SZAS TMP-1]|nr:hypothetical protein [Cyanobacteria bacterium SZAS TMP-1]
NWQDQRNWQGQRPGGDLNHNGTQAPRFNPGMDQNAMREIQLQRQHQLDMQREQVEAQQRARAAQVQQQHDQILREQQLREQREQHPQVRPQIQMPVPVQPNQQWQHRQQGQPVQPNQQWQQRQQGQDQDHDHKRR